MKLKSVFLETLTASAVYVAAFFMTFEILMPVQAMFFPDFSSSASLLFLPHGVRVLSAWLLGWRSVYALLPGVFLTYYLLAGDGVFTASRLSGIAISVLTAPTVFFLAAKLGFDARLRSNIAPCWPCVMIVGIIAGIIGGILTNMAFGSPLLDYFAFFIGDTSGLFFLMLGLMLLFRAERARSPR
ncbi:hypothetical protein NBRC116601_23780 [Cognatishimia sp. WU-CL00825]|uniref:hypothetical protein n=1 Tax=Cognatishimia sp. WU-CL00825 TaxID=3127658 RepID=UPI00310B8937